MKQYSHKEWRDLLKKHFGENIENFAFKCPMCGKISTVADFIALGLSKEDAINSAYQECIGRYMNAKSPQKGKQPCNWAAYGLFGTCGKGIIVKSPEGDKDIEIFDIGLK